MSTAQMPSLPASNRYGYPDQTTIVGGVRQDELETPVTVITVALIGIRGDGGTSHHQSRDEGAEEGFAPSSGVVHELEEAEIQR